MSGNKKSAARNNIRAQVSSIIERAAAAAGLPSDEAVVATVYTVLNAGARAFNTVRQKHAIDEIGVVCASSSLAEEHAAEAVQILAVMDEPAADGTCPLEQVAGLMLNNGVFMSRLGGPLEIMHREAIGYNVFVSRGGPWSNLIGEHQPTLADLMRWMNAPAAGAKWADRVDLYIGRILVEPVGRGARGPIFSVIEWRQPIWRAAVRRWEPGERPEIMPEQIELTVYERA